MKALPGFDSETYPFILLRDDKSISLMNTKQKHTVYQLFQMDCGLLYNNRMDVSEDKEGNLKIVTNEDLNNLIVLKMDKTMVRQLKQTYK